MVFSEVWSVAKFIICLELIIIIKQHTIKNIVNLSDIVSRVSHLLLTELELWNC